MNQQIIAVGLFLGILGGLIIDTAERTMGQPIHYAQAAEEPKTILIGTTTKEKTVEEKIKDAFPEDSDTALKIAKCESNLDPSAKSKTNKNGTTDGGLYQINSIHDKHLAELELDKFNVDDNIEFARKLYDESGWTPWTCKKLIK